MMRNANKETNMHRPEQDTIEITTVICSKQILGFIEYRTGITGLKVYRVVPIDGPTYVVGSREQALADLTFGVRPRNTAGMR